MGGGGAWGNSTQWRALWPEKKTQWRAEHSPALDFVSTRGKANRGNQKCYSFQRLWRSTHCRRGRFRRRFCYLLSGPNPTAKNSSSPWRSLISKKRYSPPSPLRFNPSLSSLGFNPFKTTSFCFPVQNHGITVLNNNKLLPNCHSPPSLACGFSIVTGLAD